MSLAEWWLIFDARRIPADKIKSPPDYNRLYEFAFGDDDGA